MEFSTKPKSCRNSRQARSYLSVPTKHPSTTPPHMRSSLLWKRVRIFRHQNPDGQRFAGSRRRPPRKTDRAALNKAAAEAAKWAQNQETVNVDVHAFDEAQAAAVAEALPSRSATLHIVSTATKRSQARQIFASRVPQRTRSRRQRSPARCRSTSLRTKPLPRLRQCRTERMHA